MAHGDTRLNAGSQGEGRPTHLPGQETWMSRHAIFADRQNRRGARSIVFLSYILYGSLSSFTPDKTHRLKYISLCGASYDESRRPGIIIPLNPMGCYHNAVFLLCHDCMTGQNRIVRLH
jgi:hypothetical protein